MISSETVRSLLSDEVMKKRNFHVILSISDTKVGILVLAELL